jgi:p-aminobenzoyl-glutamate transporter AbgT
VTVERVSPKVPKPLAVFIFLLFWAIAIVAWCIANVSNIHQVQAFIVDIGLIFAFAGFAALFVETRRGFTAILWLSLVGVVLFGVGDLLDIKLLVYSLRILGSALGFVIVPTNVLIAKLRILT